MRAPHLAARRLFRDDDHLQCEVAELVGDTSANARLQHSAEDIGDEYCRIELITGGADAGIGRGMPSTALLVHGAVMKFTWHLLLHRQAQMLAGQGIDLDVSTLVPWISRLTWWLKRSNRCMDC